MEMRPPVIYMFDSFNGEYLYESFADPSPLEPGVWIYPSNSTLAKPEGFNLKENEALVFDESKNKWSVVPDFRGKVYYLSTGEEVLITDVNELVPDDAFLERPSQTYFTDEEKKIFEAKLYLSNTDWYVTRFIETGKSIPEEVTVKRQECRDIISAISV